MRLSWIDKTTAYILSGLALITVLLWFQGGRTLFIIDSQDAFANYLLSYNGIHFGHWFIQDHGVGPQPEAHPFYYIHHPNFPARLLNMGAQLLGFSLESQMLLSTLLLIVGLWFFYLALKRIASPLFAVGTVFFFGTTYNVFFPTGADLVRSTQLVLFWIGFYLLTTNQKLKLRKRSLCFALVVGLLAINDWGFLAFALSFYMAWLASQRQKNRLSWSKILTLTLVPSLVAFLVYFAAVVGAVGIDVFLRDLLVTFSRSGQAITEHSPFGENALKIMNFYHDRNILLWVREKHIIGLAAFLKSYFGHLWFGSLSKLIAVFLFSILAGAFFWILSRVHSSQKGIRNLLFGLIVLGIGLSWSGLLAPPLFGILMICFSFLFLLQLKAKEGFAFSQYENEFNLILLGFLATLTSAGFFPEYIVDTILPAFRPPALIPEAFGFGLLICIAGEQIQKFSKKKNKTEYLTVAAIFCLLITSHFYRNIKVYLQYPPKDRPYAEELRKEKYKGKSFITNNFEGIPWYYTKGWAVNYEGHALPGKDPARDLLHRRFADWRDPKYSKPDYFLCEHRLIAVRVSQNPKDFGLSVCQSGSECDCRDLAQALKNQGHLPEVVQSEYAIVKLIY